MSDYVPSPNLDRALCPNSLAPTLGLQRREYWEEVNLLLAKWKNVNDTCCPECTRMIRVNMARHLRLVHSEYVCFWRCPVASCSLWFTSELNAKDHIENIHRYRLERRRHCRLRRTISPVMITRRITPANRSLRYLEAGTLGASEPHHVLSRPSVLVHCQFEPPVSRRPASAGPVISPLGRSHPFLAVDGSSSHPGRRQSGYLRRSPEPRRTPALRR